MRPVARTSRSPHGLERRDVAAVELMDDPACDAEGLRRTYRAFVVINRVLAGWRRVYVRRIRPLLSADTVTTLLDVGSGGGDVARSLARWAARDGLRLEVTGIDPDARAIAYATSRPALPDLTFERAHSGDLVARGARFDVVISNHVLHHLDPAARDGLLADSAVLARRLVVHGDIARSRRAYAAYWVATLPLVRAGRASAPFVRDDGLISIRRSYTARELAAVLPAGWRVERAPFRVLAVLDGRAVLDAREPSGGDDARA
ncbi:hypothetical protein GCM10025875_13360 [Litorihabitans aurantiacus]|uniref:Methyltransferase domain-containing protein n=1 Tax=Litorihabitans aurantiacus TaxID=1930061 RepID=A0AA37UJ46_9MICO|nr:hypothetical protein GCM10025875_13360 [Litorihabitans aurantiacus]